MATFAIGGVSQQVPSQALNTQTLDIAEQAAPEQTKYLCTLHGLIQHTQQQQQQQQQQQTTGLNTDPNAATLTNLLSILSSLNDNPSDNSEDISHRIAHEQQLYSSIYTTSASPTLTVTKGERILHQREMKLKQMNGSAGARTFTIIERVYIPNSGKW